MTETETTLEALRLTLDQYLDAVPRQSEPNPPDILAIFRHLDELERRLNGNVDPQLRHYMHQKSYRKAHTWLVEQGVGAAQSR